MAPALTRTRNAFDSAPHEVDLHVGRRIRLRRQILGLTQEQLATAVGISFQQIQKYELGTNRVSASRLYDIARVLGVTILFFFQGAEEDAPAAPGYAALPVAPTPNDMEKTETLQLIRLFWSCTPEQRRAVLDLVKAIGGPETDTH